MCCACPGDQQTSHQDSCISTWLCVARCTCKRSTSIGRVINTQFLDGRLGTAAFAAFHVDATHSLGRATERLIANDRMRAFSKPPNGIAPNETIGDKGDEPVGIAGQEKNRSELLVSSIAPVEATSMQRRTCSSGCGGVGCDLSRTCEASRAGLSRVVGHGGNEWWMGSTGGATTQPVRVAAPTHANCCHSGTEPSQEYGSRGDTDMVHGGNVGCSGRSTMPIESLLMTEGFSEGPTEEARAGDDEIAAPDWLEVTHALLDAFDESDHVDI